MISRLFLTQWPTSARTYLTATMAYGTANRIYHTHDATVQRDFKTSPMLIRDRAFVMAFGAIAAIEFWPIFLYADLGKLELSLRGEYKKPTYDHWMDYLFAN